MSGAQKGLSLTVALLSITLTASCGSGVIHCENISDAQFAGEWATASGEFELTVAHVETFCGGSVTAIGDNVSVASPWDRITFTGTVLEIGTVGGTAVLFSGAQRIARQRLEILRQPGTISFDLIYVVGDVEYNEQYQLQQQL